MKKTIGWITAIMLSLGLVAVGCSSSSTAEKEDGDMAESEMKEDEGVQEEEAEGEMAEEGAQEEMAEGEEGMAEGEGDTADAGPAIDGYCPVAYKMAGKPIKGKAEFAVEHGGKTWHLANEKAMKAFNENPQNYQVKYAGWCATGLAMNKQVEADPTIFAVHKEKIYLFSSEEAKKKFMAKADEMAKKAETNYTAMKVKGGDSAAEGEGMEEGAEKGAEEGAKEGAEESAEKEGGM